MIDEAIDSEEELDAIEQLESEIMAIDAVNQLMDGPMAEMDN